MIGNNYYGGGSGSTEQLGIYPIGTDGRPTGDVIVPDGVIALTGNSTNNVLGYNSNIISISFPASIDLSSSYILTADTALTSFSFRGTPTNWTIMGAYCFRGCVSLREINIPSSITAINQGAFNGCTSLGEINIPSSVMSLGQAVFSECTSLRKIVFNSICTLASQTATANNVFYKATVLEEVVLPSGWNNTIFLSNGTANYTNVLTHDSIVAMFNALADLTGTTSKTITLGATNLARVSATEIAVATAKNWTVG